MRITVRQAADAHGAPGPVSDYVGRVIPVRVTDDPPLAVAARLQAVKLIGSEVEVTLDLLGAELLWNVLTNPIADAA